MNNKIKKTIFLTITVIAMGFLSVYAKKNSAKEIIMPENFKLSKRLETLFLKTKIVCFGRYALEVPREVQLISGGTTLLSEIKTIQGGIIEKNERIAEEIEKIKKSDPTSEITYNGKGPIENSWQLQYYDGKFSKEDGDLFFKTYVIKGSHIFILDGSRRKDETIADATRNQMVRANNLRLRDENEVPKEPGYCIKNGFMSDNKYDSQEMADAGLYFPSFPDVTFSITANKNAYGDYPPAEYDAKVRGKLSLLARIQEAKDQQGKNYPPRTLLREGKRDVQHWHGEESLIRRTDGVHDFEWTLVGTPRDIAYPAVLEASMYTKVAHNMVGAAEAASLTDEEAIALWDKLLSGLKFRVKVPGAPPGSYYIDPDKPAQ
ncbi:T6SS immunity protein Tli4 family protein [Janthinobacterium rivuli]|uniref:T6SS immunity protein Tli4 family protein n=1 Tax=Janthinobacterium rivuli TaxID=2751478 RepID=A0ABY8HZ57_9BURK|nr:MULTISPECIES: T6SS immunity protein Tli4 family protein [Janthinobacterium]WFR77906.1 T6SS immunity protein Tli4 family protein [Janthinobacterium rivuli]